MVRGLGGGQGGPRPHASRTRELPERGGRRLDTVGATQSHTAGIGMRLVTSGLGRLPGATLSDKRYWFQEHLDHLRTGLCLEPRGHRSLLIAVMTEPVTPGAHFGLFFIYPGGYYVSCGEGTIGAATVALETGMVAHQGAQTRVVVDTEAGPVEAIVRADGDRVGAVTLRWTPSFVALADQTVEVDGVGQLPLDIAVGVGNVLAVVDAARAGRAGGEPGVEGRPAILPEVTGRSYLAGFSQSFSAPADPLRDGFLLDA